MKLMLVLLVPVFGAAVCVQLFLERSRRADSLGWWYTLYSAAAYTVAAFLVGTVVVVIVRRLTR
jgi:hypothetical protein